MFSGRRYGVIYFCLIVHIGWNVGCSWSVWNCCCRNALLTIISIVKSNQLFARATPQGELVLLECTDGEQCVPGTSLSRDSKWLLANSALSDKVRKAQVLRLLIFIEKCVTTTLVLQVAKRIWTAAWPNGSLRFWGILQEVGSFLQIWPSWQRCMQVWLFTLTYLLQDGVTVCVTEP